MRKSGTYAVFHNVVQYSDIFSLILLDFQGLTCPVVRLFISSAIEEAPCTRTGAAKFTEEFALPRAIPLLYF